MNVIFRVVGMSKQSFHQRLARLLIKRKEMKQLLPLVTQIRLDHPRMSSRHIHRLLKPVNLGRDRFEAFCFAHGFKVPIKRAYHRTTDSRGVTKFENLLQSFELTEVNQVWVSDITYYRIGDKFYYLTFILDLYSRFIVGYSVSKDLRTVGTTLPALKLALKTRSPKYGLIIHSDGGGQYYFKEWKGLTSKHKMRNSMCESVYENANAERINGVIKNDYLVGYGSETYEELVVHTKKAVMMYNTEKPHQSIGNINPSAFEKLNTEEQTVIHIKGKRKKVTKKEKT